MVVDSTERALFARISRELSGEFAGGQILQRAVRQAVETVEGCDFAGVSLRVNRAEVQTPAWTSPAVWAADAMQVALNEGPSLEPMWVADHVIVDDLTTNRRWPRWAPEVVHLGLGALLSVRLPGGSQTFAALNLYSAKPFGFGSKSLHQACSHAVQLLGAIAAADEATGFNAAMSTRKAVGLAQGIMKYRYGFSQERALALLRLYSATSHVSLHDAACEFFNKNDE